MWSFYIPSMAGVVLACLFLLRRYAAPRVHWFAKGLVLAGWLTSISIVALVPIDVWATLAHTQSKSITVMWTISYWSTQILTWVLIPLAQGYFDAGDFTFLGRLRQSLKDRVIYFSGMGIAAFLVVSILLLLGKLTLDRVLPWAMVLANTYGLVAGILLLGYGLVAIPRQLWQLSDPEARHRWALHRIGQAAERLGEAALEMQRIATVVEATSKSMSARDALRPFMDKIYRQAEQEAPIAPAAAIKAQGGRVNLDDLTERELDYGADKAGLASLRRRLTRCTDKFNGLWSQYEAAVADGVRLEEICKHRKGRGLSFLDQQSPRQALDQPWVQRLASLALAAASFALVWSEATIGTGREPDLSPFSHIIGHGSNGEVATQLLAGLPLAYMCGAAYFSLFKLVIFSYYRMVPRATDPVSLLLNAGQVCRFAAPLAYNFLHVIRMNERTVFATKMGSAMDVVKLPFFGADFNTWFPLTVVIYCLLLYLNVWDAVAGICLPRRFRFSDDLGDDEPTDRGRQLLRKEQEAAVQGHAVGACLALWGTVEAPGAAAAGRKSRSPARDILASSARAGQPFSVEQPATDQAAGLLRGWTQKSPASEIRGATPLSTSRPASRRGSQSGGRGASAGDSAPGGGGGLEDVFARFDAAGGSGRLGRIDDDATPPGSLSGEPPARDSPRSAWNRIWR